MNMTSIPGPGFTAEPIRVVNKYNNAFDVEIILSQDEKGWILEVVGSSMKVYASTYAPNGVWQERLWPQLTYISYTYAKNFAAHVAKELTQMRLAHPETSSALTDAQRAQTNGIIFRGNAARVKQTIETLKNVARTLARDITAARTKLPTDLALERVA